jgi:hypothetical protein
MPLNTISMGQTTQQKQTGSGQDWASGPLVGGDLQPVIIVACAAKGLGSQSLVPFGLHQVGARTSLVAGMLGSRWVPSLLHGGGGIHHPRHVRSVGESTCPKKQVCWGHVQVRVVALGVDKDSPSGLVGGQSWPLKGLGRPCSSVGEYGGGAP